MPRTRRAAAPGAAPCSGRAFAPASAPASAPDVSQEEVQPWHRLGGMEHICELRKNAQVLYGIFVTVLREIYSTREGRSFGCPDVAWDPDPRRTQLWIDTELRWEDTRPDFTPAIFVRLGEIGYEPVAGMNPEGATVLTWDGEQGYARTVQGSASLVHAADRAGAACSLADNTEYVVSTMQDQIGSRFCFDSFVVSGRAPRAKADPQQFEGKGRYLSSVSVRFSYIEEWRVAQEAPYLKSAFLTGVPREPADVAGSVVDVSGGTAEIQFGDASAETGIPVDA